jgi:hypothetical protein
MSTLAASRPWPRVKWTKAGQVAALVGSNAELDSVAELSPADAFARLRETDQVQALNFIAHCLPRLDAVRWLAAGLGAMTPTSLARRLAARKAVNRWLAEPSDANRRLAFQAGETAGFDTAEGCACLAVFLSGGSLAPATQEQAVPAPPAAFGQALAGAVLLAALDDDPVGLAGRLSAALDQAEQVAASAS